LFNQELATDPCCIQRL